MIAWRDENSMIPVLEPCFQGVPDMWFFFDSSVSAHCYLLCGWRCECSCGAA